MCLIFSLNESFKVQATVHQAVLHAKVVPGGEHLAAGGAGEAVEVVDQVPGPHHHLRGRDPQMAPGASLHRKSSADNTETSSAAGHSAWRARGATLRPRVNKRSCGALSARELQNFCDIKTVHRV